MKFYIALLLVAVAAAAPQGFGSSPGSGNRRSGSGQSASSGSGQSANSGPNRQNRNLNPGRTGPGGPPPAPINPFKAVPFQNQARGPFQNSAVHNFVLPGYRSGAGNPYGTNVYGMGINNQFARPHNIFEVQRAVKVADNNPNVLVRVDMDGDIELTDRFGFEVEHLYNAFGQDLTDI